MIYKNYVGEIEYDEKAEIFFGRVINTNDIITFQGKSVSEIKKAFKDSIDDYLDFCRSRKENPDFSIKDALLLDLPKNLRRKINVNARKLDLSPNDLVIDILEKHLKQINL